jgi:hypothetical protein
VTNSNFAKPERRPSTPAGYAIMFNDSGYVVDGMVRMRSLLLTVTKHARQIPLILLLLFFAYVA